GGCGWAAAGWGGACAPSGLFYGAWIAVRSCVAPGKQGRGGTQAAVVIDHAEATDQTDACVIDLARAGGAGQLLQGFHHAKVTSGGARLAHRKLAAVGIEREAAVEG